MQVDEDSDGEGSSSGDEVDRERVAQYEKAKLRYYFAVVECSSAVAADAVYRECDGGCLSSLLSSGQSLC